MPDTTPHSDTSPNSLAPIRTDVAVIGAGTAGLAAFRAAQRRGAQALLIESGAYGTTCARVGCMPSKLLIAAADAARAACTASRFGVQVDQVRIDGRAVMARVRAERDRFVGHVLQSVEDIPEAQRLRGHARFLDGHRLDVDGQIVEAQRIVIATGSRANLPGEWRHLGDRLLANEQVFDWADLPASLAVVGTGPLGLELAQALHRLGVRVDLFGADGGLAGLTDPEVLAEARRIFGSELKLHLSTKLDAVERDGPLVRLRARGTDQRPIASGYDYLLAATGRRPNVDQLALERSGLPLDERGVPRFDPRTGQVGDSTVFIAGDVADDRPLLHEAAFEGRMAGDNAARFPDLRSHPRLVPLAIVFTDPQVARVGQSHAQLAWQRAGFAIGAVNFEDQGRSRVMGANRGLLRLYGDRDSNRLLGAEMVGPAAEHLAHLLAWSIQHGLTIEQMLTGPYYHPVIEEGLRSALRDLQRAMRMGPEPAPRCIDCGPGG